MRSILRSVLAVAILPLAMVSLTVPAHAAATKDPTVTVSMREAESAAKGVCTAVVTVRWSNWTNTNDARVGVYGWGNQVENHKATTASHGSFKSTFTATYATTTSDLIGFGTITASSTSYEAYDPPTGSLQVHCATDWSVS